MSVICNVEIQQSTNEALYAALQLADAGDQSIDLTGASLALRFADAHGNTLDATTANGRIAITNAAAGAIVLSIDRSTIGALPPGLYEHDLVITRSATPVQYWRGTMTLSKGITP